jgi:hypothetical protein
VSGAGLSAEVGQLDDEEGSTTMVVFGVVEGRTTVEVLEGVEDMTTCGRFNT